MAVDQKNPLASTEWNVNHNATNAVATATKAAPAAGTGRHYVTKVVASFSAAATALVEIVEDIASGATVLGHAYIVNSGELEFSEPLAVGAGLSVSARLQAGGVGVVGRVTIFGLTA